MRTEIIFKNPLPRQRWARTCCFFRHLSIMKEIIFIVFFCKVIFDSGQVILIDLGPTVIIFVVILAWKQPFNLNHKAANPKCPALRRWIKKWSKSILNPKDVIKNCQRYEKFLLISIFSQYTLEK